MMDVDFYVKFRRSMFITDSTMYCSLMAVAVAVAALFLGSITTLSAATVFYIAASVTVLGLVVYLCWYYKFNKTNFSEQEAGGVCRIWYKGLKLHREDGPAVIDNSISGVHWALNGRVMSFKEWLYKTPGLSAEEKVHIALIGESYFDDVL